MPSPPRIGFQAVILCGPGTSLHPFTSSVDLPKALLAIANKPMLQYPLEWCEQACFDSILILTLIEHLVPIQSFIHSRSSPVKIKIEAPSSLDDNLGTADVLRLAYRAGWMTGDFVVLPCDLVTDLEAQEVAKMWMIDQAGFNADMGRRCQKNNNMAREDDGGRRGGFGVWYETKGVGGAAKGQETDFLVVTPKPLTALGFPPEPSGSLNTLLLNLPGEDSRSDSEVPLRRSLFEKHPNFQVLSTRRDSGIYFFPFWVLKFIERNPKINSIREDLLPWWSKCCWQNKQLAERLGIIDILTGNEVTAIDNRCDVGDMSTTRQRDVKKWTIEDNHEEPQYSAERLEEIAKAKRGIVVFPIRMPEPKSSASSAIVPPSKVTIPSITAYLPAISTAFIRRVDTTQLYLFTSLYLASLEVQSSYRVHPSASIDSKASVSRMDCLIAAKVTIAEKAVIKRCVLGYGVTIAKGAKLLGCVLMDGASVAEGANLEGCVVGCHAVIGVEAKLKDCQVAEGYFVEEEIQAKNECFVAFAGLSGLGLGYDGAYNNGNNNTENKNDQKTDGLEGHGTINMDGAVIDLKDRKVENVQRAEDDNQENHSDCTKEMKRKLEKVNSFQEEDYTPVGSVEVDSDPASGNQRIAIVEEAAAVEETVAVEEAVAFGEAAAIEEVTTILAVGSASPEGPKRTPIALANTTRWWLLRLLLVWAVPVIGFGIWYSVGMVFHKYRSTT